MECLIPSPSYYLSHQNLSCEHTSLRIFRRFHLVTWGKQRSQLDKPLVQLFGVSTRRLLVPQLVQRHQFLVSLLVPLLQFLVPLLGWLLQRLPFLLHFLGEHPHFLGELLDLSVKRHSTFGDRQPNDARHSTVDYRLSNVAPRSSTAGCRMSPPSPSLPLPFARAGAIGIRLAAPKRIACV